MRGQSFAILAIFLWRCVGAAAESVSAAAVWQPGPSSVQEIKAQCAALSGQSFQECFANGMGKAGASPSAVAFMRRGEGAYVRDFRRAGPVDIAYVTYPFRANENEGVLLVNGTPASVDIDNQRLLAKAELAKDPVYAGLAKQYPQISVWPGDRYGTEEPLVKDVPGNGRRFVVSYRLRNLCHACAVVGSAQFGFDFDRAGKFLGTKLLQVTASR
jgi:hypothetical protein